jgi:hypothetical protein
MALGSVKGLEGLMPSILAKRGEGEIKALMNKTDHGRPSLFDVLLYDEWNRGYKHKEQGPKVPWAFDVDSSPWMDNFQGLPSTS